MVEKEFETYINFYSKNFKNKKTKSFDVGVNIGNPGKEQVR